MKPIWFFVGLILLVMGIIIIISGVYTVINPPSNKTVLHELNPDIWWGAIMTIAGLIYLLSNKGKKV